MSWRGRAMARWQIFGGQRPPPPRRREPRTLRSMLALVCRTRWRTIAQLLLFSVMSLIAGLVSSRAQASELPVAAIVPEIIPQGMPKSLVPFLDLLDADGWVADDEAALLPYQRAWAYDDSPFKVCAKSRRIGITWATAYEAVEVAASTAECGGMDVWYMAQTADDAREFIGDCADWVEWLSPVLQGIATSQVLEEKFGDTDQYVKSPDKFVDDLDKDIQVFTIRFSSGWKIRALTSKPRRLRGKQGYAILDEAAYHDDLAGWLKASIAFMQWGGRCAVISTYSGVENQFFSLVEDIRSGKRQGTIHTITLHDALEQGLYRRICRKTSREWSPQAQNDWLAMLQSFYSDDFDEECGCIPRASGSSYLSRDLVFSRMTLPADGRVLEFKGKDNWELTPKDQRRKELQGWLDKTVGPVLRRLPNEDYYAGVDFGRVANLTVLTLLSLRKDLVRRNELIIELENLPHDQQDQVLDYVWSHVKTVRKVCLDAGGLGGPPSEHARDELGAGRAELVNISEHWYEAHWPPLKDTFERGLIELRNHLPLLEDLVSVKRVGGKLKIAAPSRKRGDSGGGRQVRHADGAVSLLLAEAAVGTKQSQSIGDRYFGKKHKR